VTAYIIWRQGDPVEAAANGNVLPKVLGDIPAGMTFEVQWTLHCTGAGDVVITVSAESGYVSAYDTVMVQQIGVGQIYSRILSPEMGSTIATCQDFAVTVKIWNEADGSSVTIADADIINIAYEYVGTGDGLTKVFSLDVSPVDADSVKIYLDGGLTTAYTIDDDTGKITFTTAPKVGVSITTDYLSALAGYEVVSGPTPELVGMVLDGGESVVASWTLHCNSAGYEGASMWSDIYVRVQAADPTGDPIEQNSEYYPYKWIEQYPAAHLVVSVSTDSTSYDVGDVVTVSATVTNTGWADAWDVSATLSVKPEGKASIASGSDTKAIGTLVGYGTASSKTVSWTLDSDAAGNCLITVTAAGRDEDGIQIQTDVQYYNDHILGNYEGWFDGHYIDYTYGWFDGSVDGSFSGCLEGYFTGWVYGYYYDGYISTCLGVYMYGTFEGWHEGYFDGVVDGYFMGWKDGFFDGWFSNTVLVRNPGAAIDEQSIESASVTVKAAGEASIGGEIPLIAPQQVYVGTDFQVIGILENNGGSATGALSATITVTGAALATGESATKAVASILPGSETTVAWMLTCNSKGGAGIVVTVSGASIDTVVGAATVQQAVDPDTWATYLQGIGATLESIDGNVATITTDVGTIKTDVASIKAEVISIDDGIATLHTDLGTVQTSLTAIGATLTTINGNVATITTDVGTIKTTITAVDTKLGTISTDIGTIKGTVTDIKGSVVTIQTTMGTMAVDLDEVAANTNSMANETNWGLGIMIVAIIGVLALIAILVLAWQRGRAT
jgi:archaellum component FlaC